MVQCLDKKTLSLIKCLKPNGTAAWRELQNYFKSKERPRIHQLLNKLTNLKLDSSESIRDYLVRAEELQLNLSEVNENVSDQMLCSVVLKGLPQQFANFVTVFKFSHELKSFLDLKRDLLNFDSESNLKGTDQGSSSHFSKDVKCFKCGKFGHKQAQCRSKTVAIVCYECGEKGHKANACPKAQKKPFDKRNKETQKRFFTKRNEGNLTTELNDTDGFSFHASDQREDGSQFELLIDSGCTSHMIKEIELFSYLETSQKGKVSCANGTESVVEGRGKIEFFAKNSRGILQKVALENALHVPQYSKNLISIKRLNVAEAKVIFDEKPRIEIENDCFSLESRNNLFFLRATKFEVSNTAEDTLQLWHERLGHNNKIDIRKLSKQTDSLKFLDRDDECDVCNTEKARRSPICKTVGTRASKPLEIVHVDISPEPIESVDRFKYALAFVDSFSRLGAVYLLKSKDEVAPKLELFLAELGKPRRIVSDNAKEFKFGKFADVCLRNHIRQEFTAAYTPEENGKVERVWSTIGAMVRCMLKTANLVETFWSFAIRAAFHIKNRCVHSSHGKTPFEKFFGKPPDLNHLKVFGCKAFAFVEKEKRKKSDSRAEAGILLGYSSNSKTYLIGSFENGILETLQTRNVTFNERVFPGSESFHRRSFTNDEDIIFEIDERGREIAENRNVGNVLTESAENEVRTRYGRQVRPPERYEPGTSETANQNFSSELENQLSFHTSFVDPEVRKTVEEALSIPKWYGAMKDEFQSLEKNKVWELTKLPKNKNLVSGKWHFTLKRDGNGKIIKYKARYVARGFNQKQGVDFEETYSPTVKMVTLRCCMLG